MGGWWRHLRRFAAFSWLAFLAGYIAGEHSTTRRVKPNTAPATDGKKGEEEPSKTEALVAVLGLIAPLAVALGALAVTGTVGRIQRNAEAKTEVAFILVVIASGLWLSASLLKDSFWRSLLRSEATLIAVVGTIFALVAAIATAARQPRPQIEASVKGVPATLTATVKASDLKTEDRLAIEVDGLTWSPNKKKLNVSEPALYQAYVGPDQNGNVSHKLTLRIPAKHFTHIGMKAFTGRHEPPCNDFEVETKKKEAGNGCVVLTLEK